jgi:hypothetical protein
MEIQRAFAAIDEAFAELHAVQEEITKISKTLRTADVGEEKEAARVKFSLLQTDWDKAHAEFNRALNHYRSLLRHLPTQS